MSHCVFSSVALSILFAGSLSWAQSDPMTNNLKFQNSLNSSQSATAVTEAPALVTRAEASKEKIENVSVSENVFIPAPGQTGFSVRAHNVYRDFNYKIKTAGPAQKDFETQKGIMIYTRFDHGAQNGWAIGGEVGTALGALTESRKGMKDSEAKGLSDFVFSARKAQDTEKGQMFYGGQLGFSPGERVWATEKQSGNLYSGGHSLSGFIGIQNDYSSHIFGGRARHDIYLDRNEALRTNANQNLSFTRSNGNVFSVEGFYEKPGHNRLFGASAGLAFVQPTDYRLSYGTMKQDFGSDAYQALNLSAYARLPLKEVPSLEIMPAWNFSKVLSSSGGSFSIEDSTEVSNVSVTARWAL